MQKFLRGPGLYIGLVLVIIVLATVFSGGLIDNEDKEISYNPEFLEMVRNGEIMDVTVIEQDLVGRKADSTITDKQFPNLFDFKTRIPSTEVLAQDLAALAEEAGRSSTDYGFIVNYQQEEEPSIFLMMLPYLVLIGIMVLFWYLFSKQQGGQNNKVMSFGKSRARVQQTQDEKTRVLFSDLAGCDEEKEELAEIVEFLKNPQKFLDLGARIPKGVLLVGPPGTGKTYLAKAVAGEANVPFFSISGSDFVEMFVGVGASRVRDLFEQAKKNMPCIIFIDEIDAVGRHRGAGLGGGHDEREQTLNQLLVEMDGFTVNEGIIIIAATNRPDILDPALLRPGRFDRQITVNYPDVKGREAVLKIHSRGKPMDENIDLNELARLTPWFTPADLENLLNEAAILTARRDKKKIGMNEVKEAITRVQMGPEKKSRVVTERDRKLVAYHEAGHAVVAYCLPHCDPVQEVSIIPRGQAGGYTQTLANEETSFITKGHLIDRMTMAMGGHAAEELFMEDVTTGATSDLKHATEMARRMITEYGMNDAVGPIYLGSESGEVFLGRDFGSQRNYSEELSAKIDGEIRAMLSEAYNSAKAILSENQDRMNVLVEALLVKEKMDGDEFRTVMEQ